MSRSLRDVVQKVRRNWSAVQNAIYVRPYGEGLAVVKLLPVGVEVVASSPITFQSGDLVLVGSPGNGTGWSIISPSPPGATGAAALPPQDSLVEVHTLPSVQIADPDEVGVGLTDQPVLLYGRNLSEDPLDVFTAVVLDEETGLYTPDTLVTIHDPSWIDPATLPEIPDPSFDVVQVLVDVDASVEPVYRISVDVDRGAAA